MGLSVNAHCSTKAKSEVKYNLAFGINSPITPINYYRAKDKDSWEAGHESAISGSKLFMKQLPMISRSHFCILVKALLEGAKDEILKPLTRAAKHFAARVSWALTIVPPNC